MSTAEHRNPWDESSGTAHAVALEVLLHGPIPRSEIARRLNLSSPSLTRLTKSLLQSELFVEGPVQVDPQSGRPTRPLDVVADSRLFIGIRLTEWEAQGVLTTIRAEIIDRCTHRFSQTDPASVIRGVVEVIERLRKNGLVAGVGVSIGGVVRNRRTVVRAPFFPWNEPIELAATLSRSCDLPIVVENDVVAMTRCQLWFGAGRTASNFAVITLGIATGLGLVVDNRVIEREDSGIGQIGHLPLDPYGPVCPDGHRGCAQAMLSMGGISSAISVAMGRQLTYDECLELARSHTAAASRVVEDAVRALGRLVGIVASCTLTDEILIAGEGSSLVEGFEPVLHAGIEEIRQRGAMPVRVHVEPVSAEPWSRGAATLAIEMYVLGTP